MAAVKDLSVDELRSLIGDVVEEKLRELLGDPDQGLALRPEIHARLLSLNKQGSGEAIPASDVARRLNLEW